MVEKEFERQIIYDLKQVKGSTPRYCKGGCGKELKFYTCRVNSYTTASIWCYSCRPKKHRVCKCGVSLLKGQHKCYDCQILNNKRYAK